MGVTLKLIGTGIVMGIVHVLTGPDHLSAIATLSANVGNFQSFWYGVRWGIGHSIGLVVVGSFFIIVSNHPPPTDGAAGAGSNNTSDHGNSDNDSSANHANDDDSSKTVDIPPLVESIGETFVGFFMLALGLYSMYKVWKKMQRYNVVSSDGYDDEDGDEDDDGYEEKEHNGATNVVTMEQIMVQGHGHGHGKSNLLPTGTTSITKSHIGTSTTRTERFEDDVIIPGKGHDKDKEDEIQQGEKSGTVSHHGSISMIDMSVMDMEGHGPTLSHLHDHEHDHPLDSYGATLHHDHEHHHHHPHHHHPLTTMHHHSKAGGRGGLSNQFLSICIGIVHGISGPGGVLGVIPAVQLHNLTLSVVYLGSFCITSILVMGCFAAMYGMCSSRISESSRVVEIRMEIFSSSLSILVGSMWLILISMGKLHDVFP